MSDTDDGTQREHETLVETDLESTPEPRAEGGAEARDLPDLGAVQAKITQAHEAEDQLAEVMPSAIQPDDDAYEGMSGASAGDVEETDESATTDDEQQARSEEQPVAEQVQEEVIGGDDTQDTQDTRDTEVAEDTDRS